ncbi:MAG: four helix bundle protein [Nitrospiraceae bacterium]|nr:MAG: four helix bundle protein [Nitrospiraceae bacterium]
MYWKELECKKRARELVQRICKVIVTYPDTVKYALSNQLKRSAYSVSANIVEGHARKTSKEFILFLYQARGSLKQLRYFFAFNRSELLITWALQRIGG